MSGEYQGPDGTDAGSGHGRAARRNPISDEQFWAIDKYVKRTKRQRTNDNISDAIDREKLRDRVVRQFRKK